MSDDRINDTGSIILSGRQAADRQMLALDALSKLARQFSNQPDFDKLIDVLLLTLSGQFAVSSSFALFQKNRGYAPDRFFFASGRYKSNPHLAGLEISEEHESYFLKHKGPQKVTDMALSGKAAGMVFILSEHSVEIITPLVHGNKLIGLLGLGQKVNRKPFDNKELELLSTLINSIIPFIANSFLFMEISGLNARYLNILNSVKQGVFVFDPDRLLQQINIAGYDILHQFKPGLPPIEALHQIPIELIFPDKIFSGWASKLTSGIKSGPGRFFENMTAGIHDTVRVYNIRVGLVSGKNQNRSDIIITLDDITDQTESEQRLFDLQKFAEKGQMASSIAHELNNHLGLILGGIEMTQVALKKNNIEKAGTTLTKLIDSVSQMTRFTAGLTDFSRLETQKQLANLNQVIGDVLAFVMVQKKFRNININSDFDQNLPPVMIDRDQVAQLLLNFFNNSADSIAEARRDTGYINVKTCQRDEMVEMTVSDNGKGIEPEIKDRLFKARLTTKKHGHGFGLITCAKIIENHNGKIEIESEFGNGAEFRVKFPFDKSSEQQRPSF